MTPQDAKNRITFFNTLFSNKKFLLEFIIVFVLIFVISYSSYFSSTSLIDKSSRVNRTLDTIASTTALNLQTLNAEAQLHHFILSNNNQHYEEYKNINSQIYKIYLPALKKQLEISEDRTSDLAVLATLKANMDKGFMIFNEIAALEGQKNVSKDVINNKILESEKVMSEAQANFDKLIALEEEELKSQSASAASQAKNTINIIILSIVVAGGLGIIGFFVIVFDQIKRRKLERQLVLSEEKYRLIFEHVQDVYYKTDLSGKIILISPSVEKYLGILPEKLFGVNVSSLYVNPNDRDNFMKALKVSGVVTDYPLTFKGKDNQIIYASASSHLIYDQDHNPIGVEGIVRDLTVRRKIEEELKIRTKEAEEQKNLFLSLINNSPIGVFVVKAPNGEAVIMNSIGETLSGRKIDQSINKQHYSEFFNLITEDGSIYPNQNLPTVKALEQGKIFSANDIFMKRSNGSKIALKVTSAPVYDEHGKVDMCVTVFEDITREKDIDKMKTEFVGLASHQLRSPLVAMKWLLEVLGSKETGELNQEQTELLNNIDASNQRMIDLVNIFLNVSNIESGKLKMEPTPTNLKTLIAEVRKDIEDLIYVKKHNFIVNISGDLPLVNVDPKLIKEVYLNLLGNSIEYTPPGGEIYLSISMNDGEIISQISDNGYGIPERDQKNIYNKFYRGENIVKKFPNGNGLGLYFVKAIIELSHGKIWLQSKEGEGTTFWFSLPISPTIQ